MKHEGVNSTRLAEILGIQASGISHIMSGRNKPSYDFLLKLLQRFPQINPDWLLLDRGPMYRDEIKIKAQNPSVGSPTRPVGTVGPEGLAGAIGTTSPPTGAPNMDTAGPRGLFGPDNDDIIPLNTPPASHPATHPATHPAGQQAPSGPQTPYRAGRPDYPVGQADNTPGRQTGQQPVYQAGGFARSSMIERIVVFYRDKTFSEYQPE
jgi:hypothetical protein